MTISSAPLRKLAIGHLYEAKNQGSFRWRNWVLSVVQCNCSCGLQVALGESGKTERQVAPTIHNLSNHSKRFQTSPSKGRNSQPATHIDFPCACERVCVFLIIRRTRTCPLSPLYNPPKRNKKLRFWGIINRITPQNETNSSLYIGYRRVREI